MDLETIKRYDDTLWLMYLKENTVFDADGIQEKKEWLIQTLEAHQDALQLALEVMEKNGLKNEEYVKIQSMVMNSIEKVDTTDE
ncbi:hypothetical protein JMA_39010 (plasmid) [Jeotgalibacillus malaysiensis]|uniref:Uncharacterized protein n=1 Tax=Jeotgalibacillus malaysiensis TaxID=1508404 RepID=A0A0B5AZ19_9BACL|nr:hypothetical protein [Jeotgalibacillus malaysiensis]AJD93219.1 hypothetical protein JMA_39010 [Jeotgalibacillus malaysiensis]